MKFTFHSKAPILYTSIPQKKKKKQRKRSDARVPKLERFRNVLNFENFEFNQNKGKIIFSSLESYA